ASGSTVGGTSAGSTTGTGSSGTSSGGTTGGNSTLFCDVQQLTKARCQTCHSSPPLTGVPMPLVTYADLSGPSKSNPSQTVAQLSLARMQNKTMPPGSPATAAEIATMQNWISAGMPSTCNPNGGSTGSTSSTSTGGSTGSSTGTNGAGVSTG